VRIRDEQDRWKPLVVAAQVIWRIADSGLEDASEVDVAGNMDGKVVIRAVGSTILCSAGCPDSSDSNRNVHIDEPGFRRNSEQIKPDM
jgi:hypothetical protein